MKKNFFTIAALAVFVALASSCSTELRGYNRPWLGNVANHHVVAVKNS
jgi:hypothetical protein